MLELELSNGVDGVVMNIEKLPSDLFAETLQEILIRLQESNSGIDAIETHNKFHRCGVNLDPQAVLEIIRLMSHLFRSAAKSNQSADVLVSKLTQSSRRWSQSKLELVQQLWSEHGSVLHSRPVASVGQIVDLQWKLGMAVSSDTCRSFNSPFISVLMKIADTSGEISYKSFEMTIQQFQNFHKQFKEMASVLESV